MPRITLRAILGAFEKLDAAVQTFLRTVSIELCIFRQDQVRAFEKVQADMLEAAAMQPWRCLLYTSPSPRD
eukprot:14647855-Alexandrium_andersonii.AAC.1